MTKKAEREHRKAVKATSNAPTTSFIALSRFNLTLECSKPPAEFNVWGVTRVRAWLKMASQGVKMARRIRVKAEELEAMRSRLCTVREWTLDQCQQFINEK